jgi:hypothetical protein
MELRLASGVFLWCGERRGERAASIDLDQIVVPPAGTSGSGLSDLLREGKNGKVGIGTVTQWGRRELERRGQSGILWVARMQAPGG